jgi:hypothetical protein
MPRRPRSTRVDRRVGRVLDVDERPDPGAVADHRELRRRIIAVLSPSGAIDVPGP